MTATLRFDGARLRALRQARDLSIAQVAQATGLTSRHLYRLEANQRPNVWGVTVARLAQALDTTCDYLLGLTDVPGSYPGGEA